MTRELKEGDKVRLGRTLTICEATPGHDWVGVQIGLYDGHPIRTTLPRDWLVPTTKPSLADAEPADAPEQRPMFKVGDKVRWRDEGSDAEPFTVGAILGNRVRIEIIEHGLPVFHRIVREDRLVPAGAAPQAPAPELDDEHDSPLRDADPRSPSPEPVNSARGIEPGAVVRLKSGGPQMTVDCQYTREPGNVRCVWFAGDELKDSAFGAHQLVVLFDRDGHPVDPREPAGFEPLGVVAARVVDEVSELMKSGPMKPVDSEAVIRDAYAAIGKDRIQRARDAIADMKARTKGDRVVFADASAEAEQAMREQGPPQPAGFWCDRSPGCSCAMCLDV